MFGDSALQIVPVNEDDAHGLTLVEHTCRTLQGRSELVTPFTAIYRNQRADSFVAEASVGFVVRDRQGFALGTRTAQIRAIPPLGVGVCSDVLTVAGGKPVIAELEVRDVNRLDTANHPEQFVPFPIERVRFTGRHDGHWNASGEVANPFPAPLDDPRVLVLTRDASGRLTDRAETYVGQVAANRSVPFAVDSRGPGKPAAYEIITIPIVYRGGWNELVARHADHRAR